MFGPNERRVGMKSCAKEMRRENNGEEAESGQEENLRVTPWRTLGRLWYDHDEDAAE